MAYNTRSLQGVRQVTPESSRLLREAEKFTGAAKAKIEGAAADAAMYEAGTGTPNPLTRRGQDAAKSAIIAAQQMALQGEFNPDNVVSPTKQEFFSATSALPLHQQTALYNRYAPEMRKQNLLYQQEQKSFLELQEAQRKARLARASDALQAPVSQRLEEIMGSGANAKTKFSQRQQSLFENPQALGNPVVSSLYETAFNTVGSKLDKKQKKKNMETQARFNMISQAISAGNPAVIKSLMGGEKGKGKGIFANAAKLAEATESAKKQLSRAKEYNGLLTSLRAADPNSFNSLVASLPTPPTQIQKIELALLSQIKSKQQEGSGLDARVSALDRFITLTKGALSALDEYSTTPQQEADKVEDIVALLKQVALNDEDLVTLFGKDAAKLENITSLNELYNILMATNAKIGMQGSAPDKGAAKTAKVASFFDT